MNISEILFTKDKQRIDALSVSGFFVGWPNPPSNQTLKNILMNSQHVCLAIENDKLVGFINAITDQVLSAYIPLLEVLPQYQGRGIGQMLVGKMKEDLQNFYMIDICCDENVVPFYEGLGFKRGHSVMSRNYKHQSGIN